MKSTCAPLREKAVLAIGAHPDDVELGCGASLAKLSQQGCKVFVIVLTPGLEGTREGLDRVEESRRALGALGVFRIFFLDFEDTRLGRDLVSVVQAIERTIDGHIANEVELVRVYTMFKDDRHQDHRATHDASIIACRSVPQILCYETPSSWPAFMPQVFEQVDELLVSRKIDAIRMHESQLQRPYMQYEQIRSAAVFRGQQFGFCMGEGFVIHKMLLQGLT